MEAYEYMLTLIENKTGHSISIHPETTMKDLGIDSLDLVELILKVEEKYNLTFADEELLQLKTIKDVENLIRNKTL
ncbi:MAG: acyl carrier protein [Erysipelotrichales bacterium]|nr:MAG: acyl carrier protein [Erysipelotrichales bacterium]